MMKMSMATATPRMRMPYSRMSVHDMTISSSPPHIVMAVMTKVLAIINKPSQIGMFTLSRLFKYVRTASIHSRLNTLDMITVTAYKNDTIPINSKNTII